LKDSPAERFQGFFSGFDCNGYKKTAGLFVRANKDKVRKDCYHDLVKSNHGAAHIALVKPVDLTVLELRENDLIQRLVSCCKEFEKDRITTVILGCTGMNRAADAVQLA